MTIDELRHRLEEEYIDGLFVVYYVKYQVAKAFYIPEIEIPEERLKILYD